MIPGRGIVSGPGESVALASGVGGAGQDKGTLVGPQLEQALERGARVLQPNDVVNLGVSRGARGKSGLFDAMHGIERHGLARSVENRRLVHVVPEACYTVLHEVVVKAAPPLAGLSAGEIRKHSGPGPDDADELGAIGIFHEVVSSFARIVGRITLVGNMSDVQVSDVDQMKMLFAQIGNQARE